jgi:hypothetical protein
MLILLAKGMNNLGDGNTTSMDTVCSDKRRWMNCTPPIYVNIGGIEHFAPHFHL